MLKRFGISVCILIAFGLLQAHNFVAHHHNQPVPDAHEHNHADGNHHHDSPDNEDSSDHDELPFGHSYHTADFGKLLIQTGSGQPVVEALPLIVSFIDTYLLQPYSVDAHLKSHPPDKGISLHIIFLSHSLPARAPPACLSQFS